MRGGCAYSTTNWRVAFAMYADTAAMETRSIDAVDRAAEDVNRERLKYTDRIHTYGTTSTQSTVRTAAGGGQPWPRSWAGLSWLGLKSRKTDGMNNHGSRPTRTANLEKGMAHQGAYVQRFTSLM